MAPTAVADNLAPVRRSRWLVLVAFGLLVACSQILWLTFAPITISLPGVGPVSTGPITVSLQANRLSYALFDTKTRMVQTDQFLQFDFPLLSIIGSPPPTLEFREIGPVTVGFNPRTKQMISLGALRGGRRSQGYEHGEHDARQRHQTCRSARLPHVVTRLFLHFAASTRLPRARPCRLGR